MPRYTTNIPHERIRDGGNVEEFARLRPIGETRVFQEAEGEDIADRGSPRERPCERFQRQLRGNHGRPSGS